MNAMTSEFMFRNLETAATRYVTKGL